MARRISTRGPRERLSGRFTSCSRNQQHSQGAEDRGQGCIRCKRFRGIEGAICRATPRGTAACEQPYRNYRVAHKRKAGVRNPQTGNEHHARQNDDRIGRTSDCLGRNNDECIRSTKTHFTKKGQGNNTKGGVRDAIRGHSELGAANRASVRTSWSPRPSHPQTAPDSKQMTRWGPKPVAGLCPAERIAAMCPTNSRRRLPTGKFV